jgi:hypothetical protein
VKGARVVITSALRRWTLSPRGSIQRNSGGAGYCGAAAAVCPLADLQRKGPGLRRGQVLRAFEFHQRLIVARLKPFDNASVALNKRPQSA